MPPPASINASDQRSKSPSLRERTEVIGQGVELNLDKPGVKEFAHPSRPIAALISEIEKLFANSKTGLPFHVIGAFRASIAELMAETLAGMELERAFVVHGADGWDEATPVGPFVCYDVHRGRVERQVRDPLDYGIERCELDVKKLGQQAARDALQDAAIEYETIEQAFCGYVGGMSGLGEQTLYGIGMTGIPVANVNNNLSTGSTALNRGDNAGRGGQN